MNFVPEVKINVLGPPGAQIVHVATPYNPEFIKKAKERFGARWAPKAKVWAFHLRNSSTVNDIRNLCFEVFGTRGVQNDDKLVAVRVTVRSTITVPCKAGLFLFGRSVLNTKKKSRRKGYNETPGVFYVDPDSIRRSGNDIYIDSGAVFYIIDVPYAFAEEKIEMYEKTLEEDSGGIVPNGALEFSIVDSNTVPDIQVHSTQKRALEADSADRLSVLVERKKSIEESIKSLRARLTDLHEEAKKVDIEIKRAQQENSSTEIEDNDKDFSGIVEF